MGLMGKTGSIKGIIFKTSLMTLSPEVDWNQLEESVRISAARSLVFHCRERVGMKLSPYFYDIIFAFQFSLRTAKRSERCRGKEVSLGVIILNLMQ